MAKFYKRTKIGGTTFTSTLGTGGTTRSFRTTPRGAAVGYTNVYKNGKMYERKTEHVGGYTRVTTKKSGGRKVRFRRGRGGAISINPVFIITIIALFLFAAMLN